MQRESSVSASGRSYHGGDARDWLKTKCHQISRFMITGFQELGEGRLEALHVAEEIGGTLLTAGQVRFGFAGKGLWGVLDQLRVRRVAQIPTLQSGARGSGVRLMIEGVSLRKERTHVDAVIKPAGRETRQLAEQLGAPWRLGEHHDLAHRGHCLKRSAARDLVGNARQPFDADEPAARSKDPLALAVVADAAPYTRSTALARVVAQEDSAHPASLKARARAG